jgi:hypothetical protein
MSKNLPSRYRLSVVELLADGTTKERFGGDCDSYVLAVAASVCRELRIFTDHDGA